MLIEACSLRQFFNHNIYSLTASAKIAMINALVSFNSKFDGILQATTLNVF